MLDTRLVSSKVFDKIDHELLNSKNWISSIRLDLPFYSNNYGINEPVNPLFLNWAII